MPADVDWYPPSTVSASPVGICVDPEQRRSRLTSSLFTADGTPVAGAPAPPATPGGILVLQTSGLAPGTYWVRVTARARPGGRLLRRHHPHGRRRECDDGDFIPH